MNQMDSWCDISNFDVIPSTNGKTSPFSFFSRNIFDIFFESFSSTPNNFSFFECFDRFNKLEVTIVGFHDLWPGYDFPVFISSQVVHWTSADPQASLQANLNRNPIKIRQILAQMRFECSVCCLQCRVSCYVLNEAQKKLGVADAVHSAMKRFFSFSLLPDPLADFPLFFFFVMLILT